MMPDKNDLKQIVGQLAQFDFSEMPGLYDKIPWEAFAQATEAKPVDVLSEDAKIVVDAFDEAAQYWGWQKDLGSGQPAIEAEQQYKDALQELVVFIAELELKGDVA